MDSAYLALIGTVFGGVGLKTIESLLGKSARKDITAASMRTELRLDISSMRAEMEQLRHQADRLDKEIDEWRTKYFSLLAAVATNDNAEIKNHLKRN